MATERVLFRVAGGPRLGFGHLVRAVSLARALGVQPLIALRGGAQARRVAQRLACRLVDASPDRALRDLAPAALVVDEPVLATARPWMRAAKRHGVLVVSVVDGTVGPGDADLVVDGCVRPAMSGSRRILAGARYMILDSGYGRADVATNRRRPIRVAVALGGGRHANWAAEIVEKIRAGCPNASVERAAGFLRKGSQSQASMLAAADVAVTAGGISAYEACALRVATVVVEVVPAQRRTVRGLSEEGATVDGGALWYEGWRRERTISRCLGLVQHLVTHPSARRALARRAGRLVDGCGGLRVAEAIWERVAERRGLERIE